MRIFLNITTKKQQREGLQSTNIDKKKIDSNRLDENEPKHRHTAKKKKINGMNMHKCIVLPSYTKKEKNKEYEHTKQ